MNKRSIATLFLIVAVMLLAGCRTAPIRNVDNMSLTTPNSTTYTIDDVSNAIVRAGVGLGWQMKAVNPGHIVGTLLLRSHRAVIDITYDKEQYNIQYKDSDNLNYDGSKIHKNYNGWIQRLESAIQSQMTLI